MKFNKFQTLDYESVYNVFDILLSIFSNKHFNFFLVALETIPRDSFETSIAMPIPNSFESSKTLLLENDAITEN